jgi:hypothetical protein
VFLSFKKGTMARYRRVYSNRPRFFGCLGPILLLVIVVGVFVAIRSMSRPRRGPPPRQMQRWEETNNFTPTKAEGNAAETVVKARGLIVSEQYTAALAALEGSGVEADPEVARLRQLATEEQQAQAAWRQACEGSATEEARAALCESIPVASRYKTRGCCGSPDSAEAASPEPAPEPSQPRASSPQGAPATPPTDEQAPGSK